MTPGGVLVAMPRINRLYRTIEGKTTTITPRGFRGVGPSDAVPVTISFTSPADWWITIQASVCLDFKSDCINATLLYQNHDGGHTWQLLKPTAANDHG